jgi:tRNA(Ile)-lysidine synthase
MYNSVLSCLRSYGMVQPGDKVICAVSGGADSMALLWCMYLLRDKLSITLEAAHFNHGLRGGESDEEEAFVRRFCDRFDIPLHVGRGQVQPGKKGLEAAARDARYGFFQTLEGKVATAHTADDNAETVLLHLVRGTGLKGLGGLSPVRGKYIRPMLNVTRRQVLAFLEEYCISHVEDSSNSTDAFLRNRLRHDVLPLLQRENPRIAENLSAMAQRLRLDEQLLGCEVGDVLEIATLLQQPEALQNRTVAQFLVRCGVKEPDSSHIALVRALASSDKPSARADLPGGVTVVRRYGTLQRLERRELPQSVALCPGRSVRFGDMTVMCLPASPDDPQAVCPVGEMTVRSRESGDVIRLSGGSKSLKKLFIDRKIPADRRGFVPVVVDSVGVLAVGGFAVATDRTDGGEAVKFVFQ